MVEIAGGVRVAPCESCRDGHRREPNQLHRPPYEPRPGLARGPAAARAIAWCEYLATHARRLYAAVTDAARVAAVLLATKISGGQLPSPFTARAVYQRMGRLHGAAGRPGGARMTRRAGLDPAEALRASDGGRPTVWFQINPRLSGRRRRPR
jgi:hypothetical protein